MPSGSASDPHKKDEPVKITGFGDTLRNATQRALGPNPSLKNLTKASADELVRRLGIALFNDANLSQEALVEILAARGPSAINTTPKDGPSILMCTSLSGKVRLMEQLLKVSADPALRDPNGQTALMFSVVGGDVKAIEVLLKTKSEPSFGDYLNGDTALHHAARVGTPAAIESLLKGMNGTTDVDVTNYDGRTALSAACFEGRLQAIEPLIKHSASVNAADAQGITPIMACARNGHHKALEALVWAGASVNAKSKNGSTALMEASQTGQEECIKVLIKSEASLNVVNQDGYTALLFAQVRGPHGR
jgi:ankyrin repeat protein